MQHEQLCLLVDVLPVCCRFTAPPAGVYRASTIGGNAPLSYGTVEATPDANFDRRKEVVKPRSRSAMDLGGLVKGPPNLASGNAQIPVLVTNGASVAQT